jgi:hypothetical protein
VYLNQSMVEAQRGSPYTDTPAPKVFGNVSPLDPQLFSRINDFADELLSGERTGKYSPIEAAQWIEDYAGAASRHMAQAEARTPGKERPEYRRVAIDVGILAGLGRFFGAKFRSGVLYRIYEKTGDQSALRQCLDQYGKARTAWAELAHRAQGVYLPDITVGEHPQLRGHWLDRLPAMDRDIAAIEAKLGAAVPDATNGGPDPGAAQSVAEAIQEALGRPARTPLPVTHTPGGRFLPGKALGIALTLPHAVASVTLYYRHVNQAERYQVAAMTASNRHYQATIPATYTDSAFPLEYYFEVKESARKVWLHPGLSAALTGQPYFVIRRA